MAEAGLMSHRDRLNRLNPVAAKAKLGDVIYDLIAAHNALAAQYNTLLAHLDTANVAGIGAANAATYAAPAAVVLPEKR